MKTVLKTIALVSAATALNAQASIELSHTHETSFQIGGTVEAQCKVNSIQSTNAASLNLASTSAQEIATVEIWCNTTQSTPTTTYASANSGKLANNKHTGQDIAYLLDIDQTQTGMSLTNPQTVNQDVSTGVTGSSTSRTVSIRPQVSGYEYEGGYSDTISVTVALN